MTKIADNHFRQYESLPTPFAGNGWMLRGGGNDFKAEMWQAYTDYRNGGWWVRLGKQQIAWGEALGLRVLDTVNPLDLSQNLSTDRIFEEFDRVRIPNGLPESTIQYRTRAFRISPLSSYSIPALWHRPYCLRKDRLLTLCRRSYR